MLKAHVTPAKQPSSAYESLLASLNTGNEPEDEPPYTSSNPSYFDKNLNKTIYCFLS